ncbi:hypothetical protein M0804_003798 [Polistes exclamans]|nr:hypothetical protein M0804_003798 [Polistes exclamans]
MGRLYREKETVKGNDKDRQLRVSLILIETSAPLVIETVMTLPLLGLVSGFSSFSLLLLPSKSFTADIHWCRDDGDCVLMVVVVVVVVVEGRIFSAVEIYQHTVGSCLQHTPKEDLTVGLATLIHGG